MADAPINAAKWSYFWQISGRLAPLETLIDVAYALNFSDQSHFIRDIKAFSGITPKSLSQKADAFYGVAGYSYL